MRQLTLLACSALLIIGCNKGPKEPEAKPQKVNVYDVGNGSGGTVQSVRAAPARTVKQNDMHNLHIFIENASSATGQMPDGNAIRQALQSDREMGNILALIDDGSIVLTGINQREGVWAYEKLALTEGGIVLTNNGVERLTAAELKARLGQ
jgi:hypothetical protein